MENIDIIYWAIHLCVFVVVVFYSVDIKRCIFHRVKLYALAITFMCFGTGRFLSEYDSDVTWIFNVGYVSLSAFGLMYAFGPNVEKYLEKLHTRRK